MPDVITRFAPSPTGHLHIGGARTALFCWAFARAEAKRRGGDARSTFLLRVEDTDQARSSEQAVAGILEDLAWLNIHWDEGPRIGGTGFQPVPGAQPPTAIGGDARRVGPFFQAQRLAIYNQYIDWMLGHDLAYPAFDTAEQLDAQRKAAADRKHTYRYKRDASYDRDAALARLRAGEPCVIRFNNPDAPVHVADAVLGDITFEPEHIDDFVLRKADGFPTYHFAVVIDDELMGVTHILRGQEHLNNTPRHVALQRALRRTDTDQPFRTPVYAHLPLIFNPDGSKMSKRDKDKAARDAAKKAADTAALATVVAPDASPEQLATWLDDKRSQLPTNALVRLAAHLSLDLPEIEVEDFRASGYLPEVLCNYLALLGWNPGNDLEKFDLAFLATTFDLDRIGKTNSKFDRDKLRAFNADALRAMTPEAFAARWREWAGHYEPRLASIPDGTLPIAARAAAPRASTFRDAVAQIAFAFTADDALAFDPGAVQKVLRKGEPTGLETLRDLAPSIGAIPANAAFTPEAIDAAIKSFAESRSLGMGKVAQPLRVALTGTSVSPGLGDVAAILGRDRTLARIERCLAAHS
ncbi:MAG: glutamate--tRNA ligase [Phycisphaeraceae bacterium]|nr:glutamate--tRNA ligase [Phycisphaeraceae bacterium]